MNEDRTNKKILELIQPARRILLLTDKRIDGDTIGSTLAMYHTLVQLGKDAHVYCSGTLGHEFHGLPGVEKIERDPAILDESFDLVMVFDCSDREYFEQLCPASPERPPVVVFDHHATNPLYGTVNQVLVEASSTGEVVWRFLKVNRLPISREAAQCLLTAICTDTTIFSNPNTTHIAMEAAAELGLLGARLQEVVRKFYMNKSVEALRLWGVAFERLTVLKDGTLVTVVQEADLASTGADPEDVQEISNFLIALVDGVSAVCVLRELATGGVKASLRTLTGNVAAIAKRYGGGGHVKAAGFSIPGARILRAGDHWMMSHPDGSRQSFDDLLCVQE